MNTRVQQPPDLLPRICRVLSSSLLTCARGNGTVEILRKKLAARGARGILGLGKLFKIIDDDRSGQLDAVEFKKALKEYKLNIDDADIDALYKVFDIDHSGQIHYEEFLRAVRVLPPLYP